MSKHWKKSGRRLSEGEEWRICLLGDWGFSYEAIARRVFGQGNPHHRVSATELSRIGRVLSAAGIRVRDYRNMKTMGSSNFAGQLMRRPIDVTPKIKIAS